jgi:hypothetical protein
MAGTKFPCLHCSVTVARGDNRPPYNISSINLGGSIMSGATSHLRVLELLSDRDWEGAPMENRGCGGDHKVDEVDCHDPSCHENGS